MNYDFLQVVGCSLAIGYFSFCVIESVFKEFKK